MPAPHPQALEFLLNRRSRPAKTLTDPAPDAAALQPILTAGLRVPDHGKLEPWRLIILQGPALARLAELCRDMAPTRGLDAEKAEKSAMMFAAAPLMIAVISAPVHSEKVPPVEQAHSAGAVCLSLVNAALAAGWGANWLTGWTATDPQFLSRALDLTPTEQVAGYIVLGTETSPPPERPRPDVRQKTTWLTH